jgi:hypothetical protein
MADHENSGFISTAEGTDLIKEAIREYVDSVQSVAALEFLCRSYSLSTVAGTASYVVGNGTTHPYMYKAVAVLVSFNGRNFPIRRDTILALQDPDMGNGWTSSGAVRYGIGPLDSSNHRTLLFTPAPRAVHSATVLYIPTLDDLGDAVDIPSLMGWDEFVVLSAAIKILDKEESDTTRLENRLEKCRARIMQGIADSDAGQSHQITDVSGLGMPSIRDLPFEDWFL